MYTDMVYIFCFIRIIYLLFLYLLNPENGGNDITKNSRTFFNALTSQNKSQSEDWDKQDMHGGNRVQ